MIVVILILRTCLSRPCYCSDEEKKGSIAFPHSYPHLLQVGLADTNMIGYYPCCGKWEEYLWRVRLLIR